ncbi:uncharacterized protein LOC144878735 isoform X2 [Branchiostoma floridae x Branchiostoma japonicum]
MEGEDDIYVEGRSSAARRDWMRASGASLSRLDQVRPNVYTMGAQDPRALRPGSGRRRRSSGRQPGSTPYQQIDTEPPLAGVDYQKTAWGSQTSIPELIRQQSERQRPQSGRRPWSGRGVPPPPQRKDSREQPPARAPGGLIAVLGEKYSPSERPPSGVATHNTSTWVGPKGSRGAKDEDAEDTDRIIQEILNSQDQTDKSLAKMTRLYGETQPPPPPRGSPDLEQMIKDLPSEPDQQQAVTQQDGAEGQQEPTTEILVRQAPVPPTVPLLRRPAPEPIRFAIPTGDDDEGNEEESDEELKRDNTRTRELSKDVDIVSITSNTSSPRLLPSTSTTLRAQGTEEPPNLARKLNVTIDEGQNVLINITPRNVASSDSTSEPPSRRPKSATVDRKASPDTSLQSLQEELGLTVKDDKQKTVSPRGVRSSVKSPRLVKRRVKSAKARLEVRTVSVEYGEERDEDKEEKDEEQITAENEVKKRRRRRPDDVETMVSRISMSDSEEHQAQIVANEGKTESRRPQVSSVKPNRNYYQLSLQQGKDYSEKYKTVKTIEFADGGPSETKTKTLISVTERPEGVRSGAWEVGAGEGKENHLGIKRPVSAQRVVTRPPPRPECRQGYYADMDRPQLEPTEQAVHVETELQRSPSALQQAMTLHQKPPRPHSAKVPCNRHGGPAKSPRKHSHRRPRSATVGSMGTKKEEKSVSRALVPAAPKPSVAELRRNRAAVKALKAGTLCKEKAYIAPSPPVQAVKPIVRKTRRKDSSSSDEELVEKMLLARQEDVNGTDTPRTAECRDIYDRLQEKGVVVSMDTIKKGLIPPEEKTFSECSSKLPTNSTSSLLSSPEVWLSTEFKRLRLAEKAVELANERLAQQQREERGETDKAKAKKKKKAPSGNKKKHKRSATTS